MKQFLHILFFPFKWVIRAIIKGWKSFREKGNKIAIVILPNTLFYSLSSIVVLSSFRNIKEDTTSLTNVGFAIFAGLASVCFSWTRNLDINKEPKMIARISRAGESSFHCGIIFLLASALKYTSLNISLIFFESSYLTIPAKLALDLTCWACYSIGFGKVSFLLSDLNLLIYERHHKNERN